MTFLKKLERELLLDWQKLQLETIPEIKAAALKAYYVKFESYRKSRAWGLELLAPVQ